MKRKTFLGSILAFIVAPFSRAKQAPEVKFVRLTNMLIPPGVEYAEHCRKSTEEWMSPVWDEIETAIGKLDAMECPITNEYHERFLASGVFAARGYAGTITRKDGKTFRVRLKIQLQSQEFISDDHGGLMPRNK